MKLIQHFLFCFVFPFFSITCSACNITPVLVSDNENSESDYDKNLNVSSSYLVVFGDLQNYTTGRFIDYYSQSCNWIRNQYDEGINISCILQVGDVTQNNTDAQWTIFRKVSDTLSTVIPFFVCIGNHDYTWSSAKIFNRSNSRINKYAHFALSDERIIAYYSEGDLSNYIAQLDFKDNLGLIVLEFGPRKEIVDWVDRYVNQHPDQRFILLTHEWLNSEGQRISNGSDSELQLKGYSSYSTPEEIWNQLVWPNDNIACVICGHAGFYSTLFTENCLGRQVPQILFNLQYLINGGNGLIQLWELPAGSSVVKIRIYDTMNQTWYKYGNVSFPL